MRRGMVRLREFFSGENATMARNVGSQRPRASAEQRKKEAERHTAARSAVSEAESPESPERHASEAGGDAAAKPTPNRKPQARERLGRVR